jgi:protocatechuate 3,4-dioxygenase beta subunit
MAYQQDHQDIREVKVEAGQTVNLDFQIPRRKGEPVEGVVMGLDAKPAAGITVRALIAPDALNGFAFAKSDAQGRFTFEVLAPGTAISVQDGELGTIKPVYVEKDNGAITLQLVRREKLTLPGLVTDEQGNPVAGARISLAEWVGQYGNGRGDAIATDKNGRYEIKDLYTDSRYSIAAEADGYGEVQSKLALNEKVRQLPTLKLPRADATTGGKVVDPQGNPVAGVTVHLNMGMSSARTAITDDQGRFSFNVVSGTKHLIWIAGKKQGVAGPYTDGAAGLNNLKIVLPKDQQ